MIARVAERQTLPGDRSVGHPVKLEQRAVYDVNGAPVGGDASTLEGHNAAYLLDRTHHSGSQLASTISDLPEAVQDLVGTMLQAGANITVAYDDTTGLVSVAVSGTLPAARMPAFAGGDVTSAAGSLVLTLATVNANVGSFGGAGKTITATMDGKGRATAFAETAIAVTASQVTDFSEATDDRVAALLVAGSNIGLSYNDAGNALTVSLVASPALSGTPTAPTAANATSSTQIATTAFVHALVTDLINASPATLDTLKELADAIGDDPNFATTVATSVATKLAKASNLSDLTNAATARTNLGVAIGTDVQAYSVNLAAFAGVSSAADKLFYFTGSGTGALLAFSAANRSALSLLSGTNTGDETAAGILAKLVTVDGAGSGLDADTVDGIDLGNSGAKIPVLNGSNVHSGPNSFTAGFSSSGWGLVGKGIHVGFTVAKARIWAYDQVGAAHIDMATDALTHVWEITGTIKATLNGTGLTLVNAIAASNFSGSHSGTSSGTNTGDQTSIVGITGTKAQFNTGCTDGDFVFTVDVGTAAALAVDIDGTMAANSDSVLPSQKAVRTYVGNAVAGLLDFKGDQDASASPNYPAALKGDAYQVSVAGKIGGASGKSVDVGDMFIAKADNAGGTEASVGTSWYVVEHNLVGALLAANNLSDITSASAARTNLGLVIGTNVQAFSSVLTTWAGITPGTGVGAALAIAIGSAGAVVTFNGALGTPASGNLANCSFPTLNQNTSGSAATLTTSRNIDGVAFNGSADIVTLAPSTHAATSKATPVDADELPLVDSAASNVLKKLTWANVKATLKTYFDGLYVNIAGLASGIATFLATPTSANLAAALTDETGTGGCVFATGPTMTGITAGDASGAPNLKTSLNTGSIADNGTYDFAANQGYGMFLIAEAAATGAWALCGTDGGTVKIISQSAALFTPSIGTALSVNLYYPATNGPVRVQNKRGGASNFRILNFQMN